MPCNFAAYSFPSSEIEQANIGRPVRIGILAVVTLMVAACGDDGREAQQVALQLAANQAVKDRCVERGLIYFGDVKPYSRIDGKLVTEVIRERCELTTSAF